MTKERNISRKHGAADADNLKHFFAMRSIVLRFRESKNIVSDFDQQDKPKKPDLTGLTR
jgi:hypothetical protein